MPAYRRPEEMTGLAPDGAEIRVLIDRPRGATRLSLAEALVPPYGRTAKVYHRTIYEEIWYIVQGVGQMHLQLLNAESEEIFPVTTGDAVLIRPGDGFWLENMGSDNFIFLCCGSPPWPGPDEAQPWPPPQK